MRVLAMHSATPSYAARGRLGRGSPGLCRMGVPHANPNALNRRNLGDKTRFTTLNFPHSFENFLTGISFRYRHRFRLFQYSFKPTRFPEIQC